MNLVQSIRDGLPDDAMVAGGGLDPENGFLFPAEEALVVEAATKRRREFLAGRSYARQALSRFGCAPAPILAEPSRLPQWPPGFTGTISHSPSACAAIVARTSIIAAIGLDIEDDAPLDDGIVPLVCREADLDDRPVIERALGADLPKLVFVVKEAFYKTYYPLTACFIDFADVEVAIDPDSFRFEACLVNVERPSFNGQRRLSGSFGHVGTTLFALTFLHSCQSRSPGAVMRREGS